MVGREGDPEALRDPSRDRKRRRRLIFTRIDYLREIRLGAIGCGEAPDFLSRLTQVRRHCSGRNLSPQIQRGQRLGRKWPSQTTTSSGSPRISRIFTNSPESGETFLTTGLPALLSNHTDATARTVLSRSTWSDAPHLYGSLSAPHSRPFAVLNLDFVCPHSWHS